MREWSWVGSDDTKVDEKDILTFPNGIVVGCFGGNSKAGANKNEDAALLWVEEGEWEFAAVLDAHQTAESASLVVETLEGEKERIQSILKRPIGEVFNPLQACILDLFREPGFLARCQEVQGETAILLVCRKENVLWWFSIGDCVAMLHHPELAAHGQYNLNQRHFYEWIGKASSFHGEISCYGTGVRELREGTNTIFMTTDGILECPGDPYPGGKKIFAAFKEKSVEEGVADLLHTIEENGVRDSTTIVAWRIDNRCEATWPGNLRKP
ncbi:protein phosphatase 2C domain-containing protein [Rossellomorea marisflavi]|uniref:protein phosphatase 2C domain-containing protein n=1 Tax=Rossellomorea marisflavi TaxID=189381 RepID=UPI003457684D